LRMQRAALINEDRVLLVDDWIETGSQARAAKQLVESCGARLIGVATIVSEVNDTLSELGRLHALVTAEQLSGWTRSD
jgi:adenine phosphoribosyltransferase